MSRDKLLIIGAGPVGLAMADALKQNNVAYDHVDSNSGIGGNWHNGVFDTTHIVSSKSMTAFSDYPMPAEFPDFPSASQMLAYLKRYALDRGLTGTIELQKHVSRLTPNSDDSWHVAFADGESRVYKGAIVCNGHHWAKRMPIIPGNFSGEYFHSKDYHCADQLAGKRVLVIGAGNSAHDIACDAARVGASCDMSMRSGYWFMPKTAFGRPLTDLPIWWLPVPLQRLVLRGIISVMIGDYRRYGLKKPTHKIFDRHPTYGTDLLNYLRLGRVRPREQIARFEGNAVRFNDGAASDYDVIVAATGFDYSFPFLPDGLIDIQNDVLQIYGGAFPDKVKNLYIVGASQARGGFGRLVTPAANLYAKMIKLQDEMAFPIGAVLKWRNNPIPKTHLLDTESTRRRIAISHHLLSLLKWQERRMAKYVDREFWVAPKPSADSAPADAAKTKQAG
ncbi:MAG: cation diffusion facilitator CzcD-associated flavoprotein CzcO [Hyphomicrobiaceae bacterium]|jgi:cation diffusion facilitator CzcD-associated flavoprotein CzcO